MRNHSISPVAVLAFASIYYCLKFALEGAVSGVSMAVVEGVSSGFAGYSMIKKAMLISPLFVYLAFAVLYIALGMLKCSTKRFATAVEQTFLFHIIFFAVSLIAFFISGQPQTVHSFGETVVGALIFKAGGWLPLILLGFFAWRFCNTLQDGDVDDAPVTSAFRKPQAG